MGFQKGYRLWSKHPTQEAADTAIEELPDYLRFRGWTETAYVASRRKGDGWEYLVMVERR